MSKKYSKSKDAPKAPPQSAPTPLAPHLEQAITTVVQERQNPESRISLFDLSFQKQNDFISDPARLKALFCTRRGAKSYTGGLYMCDVVEKFHEVNCLYLALTKDHAMGIIWKDVLQKIDRDHKLGMNFRESKRDVTSTKNSTIYISGADADQDEMKKLLGKKYKLIIIDESQEFTIDMRVLIYGILIPTTIDQGGTVCILGTAGNLTEGLFFDVTTGKEPGWSVWKWSAHDNPYVAKQFQEELDTIARDRPKFMETALFKQWYLNEWVIDEDAKVYKYADGRNEVPHLPHGVSDWHYVLSVDLAHSPDSTSFTVSAYHESSPKKFIVKSYKKQKLDITGVADEVRLLEKTYTFDVKVIDGANKQAVAELNNRHKMNFIAADKTGKADFIKLMNDDFIQGHIQLLPDTQDLKDEYKKLIWLTDSDRKIKEPRVEHPNIHNDCADGALYNWRFCYQYLFTAPQMAPNPNDQAVWEKLHMEKMEQATREKQNPTELNLQWNESWDTQDDDMP